MSSEARVEALTPLGSSVAAAIVSASLFFFAGVIGVLNLLLTKYPWYDVVIAACFFRTISYSCRAAYLGSTYRPALQGVFLAFVNSAYGASVATMCMTHAWWYRYKPAVVFTPRIDSFMKKGSIALGVLIVCFGPCIGVIAAGFIYGAYDDPVFGHQGIRLRSAASYGLLGCNTAIMLLVMATCIRNYLLPTTSMSALKHQKEHVGKNPRLIFLLWFCCMLLLVRGTTGVIALYESTSYVWQNDQYFYPLDTLPELMTFFVLCWPRLLARIANFWPKDPAQDKEMPAEKPLQNPILKEKGTRNGKYMADSKSSFSSRLTSTA